MRSQLPTDLGWFMLLQDFPRLLMLEYRKMQCGGEGRTQFIVDGVYTVDAGP